MSVSSAVALAALVAAGTAQVYKAGDAGVQPPVAVKEMTPFYSASAMHQGIEGTVFLETVVDVKGRPKDIKVTKSLERSLDQNAIAALRQWRFAPATKAGKPVDYLLQVSMTFDRRGGRRDPVFCLAPDLTVSNPVVVKDVKPQSPGVANGAIKVEGIVETDGSVSSVRILETSHAKLNDIATEAFLRWSFKPATRAGAPVACRVEMELTFHTR